MGLGVRQSLFPSLKRPKRLGQCANEILILRTNPLLQCIPSIPSVIRTAAMKNRITTAKLIATDFMKTDMGDLNRFATFAVDRLLRSPLALSGGPVNELAIGESTQGWVDAECQLLASVYGNAGLGTTALPGWKRGLDFSPRRLSDLSGDLSRQAALIGPCPYEPSRPGDNP